MLRRLAAFAGSASPDALEDVCGDPGLDALATAERLADRSLVVARIGQDGRSRFGLLDTVREYGRVRLREAGEDFQIHRRHVAYWTGRADAAYRVRLTDRDGAAEELERDTAELRVALDRARAEGGSAQLALATRLGWFWVHHTHISEGHRRLEEALAAAPADADPADFARARCAQGALLALEGDAERAAVDLSAGIDAWRGLGKQAEAAAALDDLGWAMFFLNRIRESGDAFRSAITIAETLGDPALIRRTKAGLGQVLVAEGSVTEARAMAEELVRIAGGDLWTAHLAHHYLADCALYEGNPAAAIAEYRRALLLAFRMRNDIETALELQGCAMSLAGTGEVEEAVRLDGCALAAYQALGAVIDIEFWEAFRERYLGPARAVLGARAAELEAEGARWTVTSAARRVLGSDAAQAEESSAVPA